MSKASSRQLGGAAHLIYIVIQPNIRVTTFQFLNGLNHTFQMTLNRALFVLGLKEVQTIFDSSALSIHTELVHKTNY